ncbi:non-canonical purine NTP pyrophosphatase, RdgB/HAM1 family [Oceanimonas doudoroffii]|uniref:dITP/XTP pyrophosphatase n=1 Tax=Oceanimonas doudoroffii TaxID=84158 RepID=A0A233RJQ1_9GAMM|nr:RdgB/HAM1 family non-canonical purine NTP pyrophosphatase [Oceanimonas doudoroffii]NHH99789.1 dITP/XTP pyrophosphatase [Oceanimonas sp. MB9]OXY83616.1 non-canonical purine NTP pyrophosphatase, RdgB/HAM1 family [Oceanimonas doudoroffii]
MTQQIVLASGNAKKVAELQSLLGGLGMTVVPQTELGVTDADETGTTFVENAIIKARHAAQVTGLPAIADDSGLAVDALGGRPGVYSARFAGEHATDRQNLELLLEQMREVPADKRQATFWCVLVFMRHADDPTPLICTGRWQGEITTSPEGENGFGYDPVFLVPEAGKTSAELTPAEKNRHSHRASALHQLQQLLQEAI